MKTRVVVVLFSVVAACSLLAQAEKIKGKAKDLKRGIEAQQTNKVHAATNAPARR